MVSRREAAEPEAIVPPAVDTLPINVAILDREGTIRYTNRSWREFGRQNDLAERAESIGRNYFEAVDTEASDVAASAVEGLHEIVAGERDRFEFDYPCHAPDERRWFRMRAAPFERDGERFVAVAHFDVTEREEYRRRLEASNERLEQFASAASHDLREPLRTVTSHLHLLERRHGEELGDDAEELLDAALDGACRMDELIEGLLDYARVDTRGEPFEPVDLNAVVDDVLADLQHRLEETDADVRVERLPVVRGDHSQLRRVVQNLVDNALEYSGDSPPRVTIAAERRGQEAVVSVSDEGVGVDPDDAERLFEVFERGESGRDREGTGIGLALCERIVDRHGGDVWLDSTPGEGTTVSFALPVTDGE